MLATATMLPTQRADFGGFWIRTGAYLIDYLVLLVPMALLKFAGLSVFSIRSRGELWLLSIVSNFLLWLPYKALLESSAKQGTVGKMACGLRVVDENGDRIGVGQAVGRYFAMYLSALPLLVGLLMVIWTEKRQGFHDELAKTYVLKNRRT